MKAATYSTRVPHPPPALYPQSSVAAATEGYAPADLATVVVRAQTEAVVRQSSAHTGSSGGGGNTDASMTLEDFKSALRDFVPACLRGVKLFKSTVAWSHVGGLEDTRRVLRETLELPLQ